MTAKRIESRTLTPVQQLCLLRLQEAADRRANLPGTGFGEGAGYLDVTRLARVADHTIFSLYEDCRDHGLAKAAEEILVELRRKISGARP